MTNHRGSPEDFVGKWFSKLSDLGLANGVGKDELLRACGLFEKIEAVKERAAAHKLAAPPLRPEMPMPGGFCHYGDFGVGSGCVNLSPEDDYRQTLQLLREQPVEQIEQMRSFMRKMQK